MNQVQQFIEYILNAIKVWIIVQPWEAGLRVRCGNKTKLLKKGIYFRFPYFDSVYIQESRLRVSEVAIQTLTSKDEKTLTLNSSFGYSISCIETLYKTLYQPETTLQNMVQSEVANYIFERDMFDIKPKQLEEYVLDKLTEKQYGLKFEYFKITNFAVVKTFRLIQDHSYTYEGLKMDNKK